MKPFQSNPRVSLRTVRGMVAVVLAVAAGACESTGPMTTGEANIFLSDANNYTSMSKLTIPRVETASATDLEICWEGVTKDIQCHAVAPMADIDYVGLTRFRDLTEAQVQDKLTAGEVDMAEVDGYLEVRSDHMKTCARLKDFSFFMTPIQIETQYVEAANYTYMMVFGRGDKPGVGARSMTFLKPLATNTNTKVNGPSGCGFLEFSANLSAATPLAVPRAKPWIVEWRQMTKDGQGNPISFPSIDSVLIGFYKGMTVSQLQDGILDLEQMATSLYEVKFMGAKSADLSKAKERKTGAAFPGFEATDGVWILGLMCSACQNPAPVVLTILNPS